MKIELDLYSNGELRAFATFLTTMADVQEKMQQDKRDAYVDGIAGLGGIDRAFNPAWGNVDPKREGGQTEPLVLDEKAFLAEAASQKTTAPVRKRGEPSPGHKRRTKAEIAEDEAADRHPEGLTAETAAISTGGERVAPDDEPAVEQQDVADEADETAKAGAELSHDDVRNAMGQYVTKFGMDAAQIDIPKVFQLALKDTAVTKVSLIPGDQGSLKKAVDGVMEMLAKNPFSRDAVA